MATKKKLTDPEALEPNTPQEDLNPAAPQSAESIDSDATDIPVEGADIHETNPPAVHSSDGDEEAQDGAARDEDSPEQDRPDADEDRPHDAFAAIAQQLLQDLNLPVVFLTTDGTAFYGYSDALNYAQTLPQSDVLPFLAGNPSDEEIRQLLPPALRPKHLRDDE